MTSKYLEMTSVSWLYPFPPLRRSLPLTGTALLAWLARPGRPGAERALAEAVAQGFVCCTRCVCEAGWGLGPTWGGQCATRAAFMVAW